MIFAMFSPIMTASANTGTKPFKQNAPSESTLQLKAAIAEQLNVLDGGPKLHKDLEKLSGNQDVAVIIHLSEKPVALEKGISELKGKAFSTSQQNQVRTKVKAQQTSVKKELSLKNISIKQGYSFDTVLNGFAAVVKANDLPKLLTVQGVTLVEPDTIVYAMEEPKKSKPTNTTLKDKKIEAKMNTSISFLGIEKLWNEGFEGQGIKVAVLDTGIDANHPEFAGIYKGGKNFIPNSSDYTRTRSADDASETSPVERPAGTPEFNARGSAFYTSHGTHVAGTIAAIGANEYGIKGIAPKVDLYAYRVLGAYGSGANSGIVKAIDTAVIEGMDVINLSLGGENNSETDSGSFAINNAMMAGTIAVVATGNSGPNRGTIGTPSTARLGIAVGNTTNPETMYNGEVNVKVGQYNLTKQLQLMGTTFGKDLATQLQGEFDLVAVPGNGEAKDYQGIDVNGKVALISRGSIAFVDKIAHAKANGAVATIIHNFAGGTNAPNASGTFLGDSFAFLPTFDMSQTDGDAIRAALANGAGKVTFGKFGSANTTGDEVNDSSSRGPTTPNFDIKPDVSAPGTNIMSTIPMYKADFPDAVYNEAYDRKTGTSMATPHIAGIAALVQQANPSWNAFDVKVALSNTAKVLNTAKYDVFAQGAGRVNAYAAARPNVLAYALDTAVLDGTGAIVENKKGTVTFGPQSLKENNISVTKQILVKDIKGQGGNYNVTVDTTKTFGDAKLTIDKPTFTLAGEQLLNVTLTASKATAPNGSEILGYIHINGGGSEISLPFAADFGGVAATEIRNMAITGTDLSFNGDGVKDSAVLSFTLTGDVATNYIEIWDIMNPEGGEYGDGYIGYLHAGSSLGKGSYTLNVAGQYKPWGSAPATTIPDGLYTIDFTAQAATGVIGDYVGPVVVKTTKPAITGSVKDGIATGHVTDKYIEYNEELYLYGLEYDLNEKLNASYIATINGNTAAAVDFDLAQDGSFTFPVTAGTDSVTVVIKDAAGNVGEALIYENDNPEPEPVVTLSVNPTKVDLETGGTAQLSVTETTTPAEGTATVKDVTATATYAIADESVAKVSNGLVTAVGKGSTTITITHGKNNVTVNVTVKDPVVIVPGVKLVANKTQIDLEPKKEAQLTIKEVTTRADGTIKQQDVTKAAKYTVANNKVANVKDGLVTAKAVGSTTITAKYGKNEVTIKVDVTEPVVTLVANKTQLDLDPGKEAQLTIKEVTTGADGKTKQQDVTKAATYKVADGKVASVKNGLVTAKAAGSTTITAKYGKNEVTINVTVTAPGVTLTANKTQIDLEPGKEAQLIIKEVTTTADGKTKQVDVTKAATYTVANSKVATVTNGLVIAKAAGTTTISVKYGKNELNVNVNVTEPVVTLIPNKTQIDLEPGKEAQLTIKEVITSADGKTKQSDVTNFATYKVANNKVATVSSGLIKAKAVGSTTITVKYGKNEATVNVTVTEPEVTLTTNKTQIDLEPGKESQLTIKEVTTTVDGKTTERNVTKNATYKVANGQVASVNEGVVKAKATGSSTITVKYGKNELTVNVTVTEPQVTLSVDKTQIDLEPGKEAQLSIKEVTTTADGKTTERDVTTAATYKVADGKVASVTNGLVRAKATGNTTITVKYGKNEVTVNVAVTEPVVTLVANQTQIDLESGKQAQLTLKEVTTTADGRTTERDVTTAATYKVANSKVASVSNGLVSAKEVGSTTISVKYGKNEVTVNVIVKEPELRSIVPNSESSIPGSEAIPTI
ncbi:S8 family serine peptidase [Bacillus sp. FJAT-22090]|uniref:S8 family serine peptidase n=1 Tax=Bacillus sp. FJAT-22090 TaxID=1581038 RepID=UPI0009EB4D63|nr:S8 family serine peptidase [Bacillus sp. FJAT-22090]